MEGYMRLLLILTLATVMAYSTPGCSFAQPADAQDTLARSVPDLSGTWRLTGTLVAASTRLRLKQDGNGLSGILTFMTGAPIYPASH